MGKLMGRSIKGSVPSLRSEGATRDNRYGRGWYFSLFLCLSATFRALQASSLLFSSFISRLLSPVGTIWWRNFHIKIEVWSRNFCIKCCFLIIFWEVFGVARRSELDLWLIFERVCFFSKKMIIIKLGVCVSVWFDLIWLWI